MSVLSLWINALLLFVSIVAVAPIATASTASSSSGFVVGVRRSATKGSTRNQQQQHQPQQQRVGGLLIQSTADVAIATTLASSSSLHSDHSSDCHQSTTKCRSNATHLVWYSSASHHNNNGMTARKDDDDDSTTIHDNDRCCCCDQSCEWQTIGEARTDAYQYLRANVMKFDVPFLQTMGFDDNNDRLPDGLDQGVVQSAIRYAIRVKQEFVAADTTIPKSLWLEYVLNYANLNEGRSTIRDILWQQVIAPLFLNGSNNRNATSAEMVETINREMWTLLAPRNTTSIVFVSGQTPAIFDPMSVLVYGHASCTGLAILFVQALRTAGIPARVAGTAAWHDDPAQGNHNWVEVWTKHRPNTTTINSTDDDEDGGYWSFLEPSPAQTTIDTIDRNPCERWFCHPNYLVNGTQFFAATLSSTSTGNTTDDVTRTATTTTYFPLAWEWNNHDVPAVNRTEYYHRICSQCGGSSNSSALAA